MAAVPDVTYLLTQEALPLLHDAGFRVRCLGARGACPQDVKVIKQSPAAGESAPAGSVVELTLAVPTTPSADPSPAPTETVTVP
jgi:beta-lactam-binding protein with PASTA domain